ncbi:MAG: dipeptidase [Anaerolineales bacterium]
MAVTIKPGTKLCQESIVIDGLISAPISIGCVRSFLEAGITASHWTIAAKTQDTVTTLGRITQMYWMLEQFPEKTLLVEKSTDIERARHEGKLGIIMGFQGGGPLSGDVQLLRIFHKLGVRIIALTYNEGNIFGSGCTEPSNGGLTSLGIQAVEEMNRLGILVDLTHLGERSAMESIDISEDPVIFSHSNPSAVWKNPRNINDKLIRRCTEKGGVIGLATFSAFVGDTWNGRTPTLNDLLNQMDHILNLIGPDHLAIGTDILIDPTDGVWWRAVTGRLYPEISQGMTFETHNIEGFANHADFPRVVDAMLDRGYGQETVGKILGGNFMRIFHQVWDKSSAYPQQPPQLFPEPSRQSQDEAL